MLAIKQWPRHMSSIYTDKAALHGCQNVTGRNELGRHASAGRKELRSEVAL